MPQTTNDLAVEYGVTPRQVLNYKEAVERHTGQSITYKQGRAVYYRDEFLPLLRMVAKGETLPRIEQEISHFDNPFKFEEESAMVLHTSKLAAPIPISAIPFQVQSVDCSAINQVTDRNFDIVDRFKGAIESQVLGEARSFGVELGAKVRNIISREVATAYRDIIKQ